MRDYKFVAVTILLTLTLSFTVLLSSGLAVADVAGDANVADSGVTNESETPDGLYTYSISTVGEVEVKRGNSWTDTYTVTDKQTQETFTYSVKISGSSNTKASVESITGDCEVLILVSPNLSKNIWIQDLTLECKAVYLLGDIWMASDLTMSDSIQSFVVGCNTFSDRGGLVCTSGQSLEVICYLNSDRHVVVYSKDSTVNLHIIWSGDDVLSLGTSTSSSSKNDIDCRSEHTRIYLPVNVYLDLYEMKVDFNLYPENSTTNFVERSGSFYYVGDSDAKSVSVPSNVTSITQYSFYGMTELEEVKFEGSLESIGNGAFQGCTSLASISIPNGVTSIGSSAFSGCTSLEHIFIPNSVTYIDANAFFRSGLKTVEFEAGGTSSLDLSKHQIFSGTSIESIEFPARTTVIGAGTLNGCNSLKELTFEESDSYMLQSFQQSLTSFSLTKLYMPMPSDGNFPSFPSTDGLDFKILGQLDSVIVLDGITYIRGDDESLTMLYVPGSISGSISLPDGLKDIPSNAFYQSGISSVTIPASVTSIGSSAFWRSSLETVVFAEGSKLQSIGQNAFYDTAIKEITLLGPMQSIGQSAFRFCGNLETVTINGTNLEIGDSVFRDCGSLMTVNISADSLTIGSSAFYGTALTGIELPEGTTSIGGSAFTGTRLASIHIPATVASIGFSDSSSPFPNTLKEVIVDADNIKYLSEGNVVYEIIETGDSTTYKLVFIGYGVTELVMKAGTTDMLENVFRSHTSLQKVVFPEGFPADIGYTAFQGCSSLTTVDASNASFASIEQGAFNNTPLTQISSPDTLTTIGVNAFLNCSELTALDLSGTKLSSVGNGAFTGCTSLVSVSMPSTLETWPGFGDSGKLSKVTIASDNQNLESVDEVMVIKKGTDGTKTLTYVVPNVSRDDDGLRSVTIPKDVTSIDISAFRNATLDAVYVEEGNTAMSSMGNGAAVIGSNGAVLYIASAVESIELPDTVSSLSSNVLEYATALKRLAWGGSGTTGNLSIPSASSGLDELVLTTTGSVTMGSMTFNNISSISVTCGSLSVTSITSQSDYDLSICAGSISGEGFIGGSVASISISGTAAGSVDVGELLGNGTYDAIDVSINGEVVDVVKALTGKTLTVQDLDGEDIPFEITSVIKDDDGFSFVFLFDYQDFTVYDVDAIVENAALDISGNGFVVDVGSADVTVTISEKSESSITHTVTFDPAGGSLPSDSDTLRVGHGRTISTSQLNSMEPSRDGYVFKGWYTDAILSNAYDRMQITDDMTLYARWEPVNGHVVGIDDPYGRVTATYPDGRVFYSGDRVEDGTVLTLEFRTGNGIDLLGWTVTAGGTSTTAEAGTLEVTVDGTMQVTPNMRVFSTSNSLINITDLPTPEWENITTVWSNQYDVDTSMLVWTGMPSIPVIVDDYVYVRAADTIYKLSIYTGETVDHETFDNTTSTAYYSYLGYGGDVIVDYNTQSAYDLDLNLKYELPKAFTAVFYDDGYFYGLYGGCLWKFDAETGSLVNDGGWSDGVEVSWHGIYGTTSTPVFDDGWVYFVEASGDDRMIGAVNLETGDFDRIVLDEMNAYLCDDGWLTMYEYKGTSYLFVTGYKGNLFDSGTNGDSIVMCIALNEDGTFADGSERWMKFRASAAASAFVVVDGRGYINVSQQSTEASVDVGNAGGAFYVVDVHKFLNAPQSIWTDHASEVDVDMTYNAKSISGVDGSQGGWLIYVEQSISTHGSIVVSTAYMDDTGRVYIYLLPYNASQQALYTFCDWDGKTSATGYLKSSPVGENYGSQAIRVGPNGELIWYTDSGTIWCVRGVSGLPFQFLIQDSDGAQWVEATGVTVQEALYKALQELYADSGKNVLNDDGIITVNGTPVSVYFEDGDIWIAIDTGDNEYNAYRTFFVSLTILADEGEPMDLNQVYGTYYLNEGGNVTEYNLLDILDSPPTDGYFSRTGYVTVTVDANGGKLAEGTEDRIVIEPGTEVEIPAAPSRTGYNFLGWEIDGILYKASSGTEIEMIAVDKGVTMIAKWEWADESTKVGGVTITSDSDGFTDEPSSGRWVDYIAAGYAEDSEDAYDLMHAANSGFTDEDDVADRTMFLYFAQRGTGSDSITGRLFLSDGTQIYQETLDSSATMWYVTLSETPNSSDPKYLNQYYKLGETYTMAIYVNGEMACSVDITVSDGKVADVTYKGSSVRMSEGETIVLTPRFYIGNNDTYSPGNVAQSGVTWASSNPRVATIDANGILMGVSAGTAVITVTTDDGGHVAYCYVTVEPTPVTSVTIDGSTSVSVGGSTSLTADYGGASATVSWTSSNPAVAIVDSDGNVTGVSAGTAVITVSVTDSQGNTKTANCVVTVSANLVTSIEMQETMSLQVGGSGILTAEVGPVTADNRNVIWSTSNSNVAIVVNGTVTAVGPGTAIIIATAADGSGFSANCVVTVSKVSVESVTLSSRTLTLNVGGSSILTATVTPDNVEDRSVVWMSSDSRVATVVDGVVTAVGPGTATITVSTVDGGKTATCTVTVKGEVTGIELDRTSVSMTAGDSVTLEYSLLPEGTGGYTVSWSSSDTSVATVSNGRITAVGPGTATITATVGGTQLSAVCSVTVVGSSTETGTTTEENDDGSVTTTVTEEIDAGDGTSVDKVTETTTMDGSATSTVTTYTVETDGSRVVTTVTITSDANGSQMIAETFVPSSVSNGVRTVSPADMRVALEQMGIADAVTGEDVSSTVTVNVSTGADVSDVRATIPSESVTGLSGTGMTLVTDIGSLDFAGGVFDTIGDIGGDAMVNISRVTGSGVPSVLDGMSGVSVFEVTLSVGGTSVHQLGGTVTMSLPYALGSGQSADGVKVYYVDDNGDMTLCQSSYDAEAGVVSVPTDHFSTFAIVYEAPAGASDGGDDTVLLACIAVMGAVIAVMAVMIVVMYSRGYLKRA